jgi:outer membrane protein TolC
MGKILTTYSAFFVFSVLFFTLKTNAQSNTTDSSVVLDYKSFMQIVMDHHPMSAKADLKENFGDAVLQMAKGAFDPKAFTSLDQKYFDGSKYYSLLDAGLKLPTWFGLELKSGFEQNEGAYLNPQNRNPDNGLWYAGASITLGRGLLMDDRRAELKKGELYRQGTELERKLLLNELNFQASVAYWSWYAANKTYEVLLEGTTLAEQRYEATRRSAELGDRPSIDTLEASIQFQQRQQQLLQAQVDLANSKARIEMFLWLEGQIPMELEQRTIPSSDNAEQVIMVGSQTLQEVDSLLTQHPEILLTALKISSLEVDLRLKREMLKPVLDLNYNAISEPIGGDPLTAYSVNNYKWGVNFSMPLFLRKERGALSLTQAKMQDTQLDLELKKAEIRFKTEKAMNTWTNSDSQFELFSRTTADYRRLFEAEQQLFDGGESSLFLVNTRENALINAELKLLEIVLKNRMALSELNYVLALFNN